MYSMDHIGLGTCDLDFALDHFSGCLPEEAKIKNLLNKLCSAVLSCDLNGSDAFYDTWTTIQRCAAVCPSTVADVLAYASSATEQCNAREMFAAILESIYTMTGWVAGNEEGHSLLDCHCPPLLASCLDEVLFFHWLLECRTGRLLCQKNLHGAV